MLLTKLGKYRIISWLGGGGFGDVYLAEDTLLGKRFALKVSRVREKELRFLKREAQLLASLDHPNIVRFYNLDLIDGKLVLVMEYVEGESLRAFLEKKGRMELGELAEIFLPVLDALGYAHSKGLIHRDIKPENILISREGEVKLVDFGLGIFLRKSGLGATFAGTPSYMPPEAWRGIFLPSGDIYSLAVVIYEALTGRNPFDGETLEEIRRKVFEEEAKPLSFYLPSIPSKLDQVLRKAFSKKPEDRYLTASAFKDELVHALNVGKLHKITNLSLKKSSHDELDLTPAQKDVVFSPERRILLVGGAGTGKTTTLLYRLYRKLREGADVQSFLVLSFTRKSVKDLKNRLSLLLGKDIREMWIETFHGALYKLLKREAERFGFSPDFSLIPSSLPILREVAIDMPSSAVERILSEISLLRVSLISPDEFLKKARSLWEKKVAELYDKLVRIKKEQDIMDFDDLLFYGAKLLQDPDLREIYSARFKHIFVDELQDLNEAQYCFIKFLVSPETELFLTGDSDQSIYSWRGAVPGIIERAERELGLRRFALTHSFRLPSSVLRVAASLMSHAGRDLSNLISLKGEGKVELYIAKDEMDEARFVVRTIKELSKYKSFSSMAVLYRHNSQSRLFEDLLARAQIPYEVLGALRFYEREEVKKFTSYLRGVLDRDLEAIADFFRWLLGWKSGKFLISGGEITLQDGNFKNKGRAEKLLAFLNDVFSGERLKVEELLKIPIEISGLLRRRGRKWEVFKEVYIELLKLASSFSSGELGEFLNHVSLMEEIGIERRGDAVKLLTFHSSKGLEFDTVFITGLVEGKMPPLRSLARLEELEEERRLLFVGITRAADTLYLCYPKRVDGRSSEPSRFLLQLLGML